MVQNIGVAHTALSTHPKPRDATRHGVLEARFASGRARISAGSLSLS
jgi:hypothetical protein